MQPRIKKISRNIIFKNIGGILVLCTFLLSITPKQVLHNFAANHTDRPAKKLNGKLEYNQVGFNCDCNSIVATSPFTESSSYIGIENLIYFSSYGKKTSAPVNSADCFYFNLRGPPVIA